MGGGPERRDLPIPAIHSPSVMPRCGPSNRPFAAPAKSGLRWMTATRTKPSGVSFKRADLRKFFAYGTAAYTFHGKTEKRHGGKQRDRAD